MANGADKVSSGVHEPVDALLVGILQDRATSATDADGAWMVCLAKLGGALCSPVNILQLINDDDDFNDVSLKSMEVASWIPPTYLNLFQTALTSQNRQKLITYCF